MKTDFFLLHAQILNFFFLPRVGVVGVPTVFKVSRKGGGSQTYFWLFYNVNLQIFEFCNGDLDPRPQIRCINSILKYITENTHQLIICQISSVDLITYLESTHVRLSKKGQVHVQSCYLKIVLLLVNGSVFLQKKTSISGSLKNRRFKTAVHVYTYLNNLNIAMTRKVPLSYLCQCEVVV